MILNGDEIISYHNQGLILIEPWNQDKIGTNSYDVTLGSTLLEYKDRILDPRFVNETREIKITEDGWVLNPGSFVLGSIAEKCQNLANDVVPMIEGKSSIARLGLTVHITAGFGDVGYCGSWTLEMTAAKPIVLYPGMPIAQLWWVKTNPTDRRYKGKYQNQFSVAASRSHADFR